MRALLIALMLAGCAAPTMPKLTGDVQADYRRIVAYCEAKANWEDCTYRVYPCGKLIAYVKEDEGTVSMFGTDQERFLFEKCMTEVKETLGRGR